MLAHNLLLSGTGQGKVRRECELSDPGAGGRVTCRGVRGVPARVLRRERDPY